MRCPKCDYISFDHLERCKRCNKKIGAVAESFEGTVFDAPVPSFLRFQSTGSAPVNAGAASTDDDLEFEEVEESFDELEEVEEELEGLEVNLEEAEDEAPAVMMDLDQPEEEEGEIRLEEIEEAPLRDEFELDLGAGFEDDEALEEADEDEAPVAMAAEDGEATLDFGDMDISDLAPPDIGDQVEEALPALDEVGLEPAAAAVESGGSGLEDLKIEGMDLGAPTEVKATGVKTGTALDDFDFDLKELLANRKKK